MELGISIFRGDQGWGENGQSSKAQCLGAREC